MTPMQPGLESIIVPDPGAFASVPKRPVQFAPLAALYKDKATINPVTRKCVSVEGATEWILGLLAVGRIGLISNYF